MSIFEIASAVLTLAAKYNNANGSSMLAYQDAVQCYNTDRPNSAIARSLDSLRHSVGIFHADYRAAKNLQGNLA